MDRLSGQDIGILAGLAGLAVGIAIGTVMSGPQLVEVDLVAVPDTASLDCSACGC